MAINAETMIAVLFSMLMMTASVEPMNSKLNDIELNDRVGTVRSAMVGQDETR